MYTEWLLLNRDRGLRRDLSYFDIRSDRLSSGDTKALMPTGELEIQ